MFANNIILIGKKSLQNEFKNKKSYIFMCYLDKPKAIEVVNEDEEKIRFYNYDYDYKKIFDELDKYFSPLEADKKVTIGEVAELILSIKKRHEND